MLKLKNLSKKLFIKKYNKETPLLNDHLPPTPHIGFIHSPNSTGKEFFSSFVNVFFKLF
jgi:hypothetical protein